MTWQLMKRDPAWQWMPMTTLTVASACVMWHFLALADPGGIAKYLFEIVFLFLMFAAPAAAMAQQSETGFQSTLPITVRQVFLARTISMVSLLWLPVVAGITVLTAVRDPGVSRLPLKHWLAFTAVVLVTQCAGIRGYAISRRVIILLGSVWMFGYGERWLLAEFPATGIYVVTACCVIAGGIVLRTWRTVPPSFQDSRVMSSMASLATTTAGNVERKRRSSMSLWKPPLTTLFRVPAFVLIPFVFILLQGAAGPILYAFLAFRWAALRTQLRWLFALPLSPRAMLAVVILPTFFAMAGGYLLSVYLPPFPNGHERRISVRARQETWGLSRAVDSPPCKTMNVLPSLDFWVPVRSGAPLLQAPWGETFQPSTYRVSGYDIYNPYAVGCNNSERFLDWQFKRATVAAFGRPLDREKSDSWYIVDWHAFVTGPRMLFVNIAVIAGVLFLSMLFTMVGDWHRFRALPLWVRIALVVPVGAMVGGFLYLNLFRNLDIVQWVYWTLPDSPAGAVAVAIAFLAPLCLALAALFRQLEFVDKPATPRT